MVSSSGVNVQRSTTGPSAVWTTFTVAVLRKLTDWSLVNGCSETELQFDYYTVSVSDRC